MLKISVVIPTYNRCAILQDALNSLLIQKIDRRKTDYEVIVVDNNSADKTSEMVAANIAKFNYKLKYVLEHNQGYQYALNTGIKQSNGDVIALTDDDCILPDNWIYEISSTFEQNKDILFLCGQVHLYYDNKTKIPNWCEDEMLNSVFGYRSYGNSKRYLNQNDYLPGGANMFLKKELFTKIGFFNVNFNRGADTEFSLRVSQGGISILYSPNIITLHRVQSYRLSKKYFMHYYYISGEALARSKPDIVNNIRKIFTIPLWVIKKIILEFTKIIYWFLKMDTKKSFNHQAKFSYLLGVVKGRLNDAKNKCYNSYV